ncbi:MAG: aspartyl protease family protein, partial [Thermoanaerobaculia bacterium]
LIIERISGEKYRDYVQKHIFAPAGMKDSGFFAIDEKVAKRATGYTKHGEDEEYKDRRPNNGSLPGRPSSAGGAYATGSDLLRFFDAASSGKLLSPKWTTWMFNGPVDATHKLSYGTAGGAPGINSFVEINDGWTVIAMSNYDPPAARAVTEGAMNIIRGKKKEEDEQAMMPVHRTGPPAPEKIEMTTPVSVPLTTARHLVLVEAKVNGKGPFHFVIDSGAAGTLHVNPELAKTLALEQIGEAMTGDPSGKNAERRPIVRIDSLELGGARFTGIESVVSSGPGAELSDGVIGLGLFANLTATVDYRKQELRLTREALTNGVPFTLERGIPVIDIDVAGVPMKVDVDLGSPAMLSIPTSWASRLPLGESRVIGRGRTLGNELEIRGADLKGDLHVAGFTKAAPRVDIVDIFPVANLGSSFLRDYAVSFDMKNRRLALAQ